MFNEDRVDRALRVTLERFENGQWMAGSRHKRRDGRHFYCLVGSLQEQLVPGIGSFQYTPELTPSYNVAIRALGFGSQREAWHFNDDYGRARVIERIQRALQGEFKYTFLHRALDESRVEHAKRDLGRKIPNVVPLAWMEEQFAETFAEEARV